MTSRQAKRQAGFTLIELLVAFSILAMSLGLIYKSMGSSARQTGDLALHQQASHLANALLQTKDSVTSAGWQEEGAQGGFTWSVSSKVATPGGETLGKPALHAVSISIQWVDGSGQRKLDIDTLLPQRSLIPAEVVK